MSEELDLKAELKEELRYRLRSPFYSSLLIAFILWNWRAVVIMLYPSSETDLAARFVWIEKLYPEGALVETLVLPVISACIAVAGIPWAVNFLDDLRYQALVRRRNNRKQRDEKLLEVQKRISELNGEISGMRKVINELEDRNKKVNGDLNMQSATLDSISRSFTSVAVVALGREKQLMKMFRDLNDREISLTLGEQSTHTLLAYGLIDQDARGQHSLTPIGKSVQDFIRQHVEIG